MIDFANPANNEFLVVNQFTVQGSKQPLRPDLVAFINGLPVAVIELKNPANEQVDIWDAFNQLQTYKAGSGRPVQLQRGACGQRRLHGPRGLVDG